MADRSPSSAPYGQSIPSWRQILFFDLFLLSLLILSTRLATFLHESMGHALSAVLFGGRVDGIRLSLFGGGNTFHHFDASLTPPATFLVAFSGILVNLIFGVVALRCARRSGLQPQRVLFLSLFGMVNVLGGLSYACLGLYYRVGDPAAWMRGTPWEEEWLWVPFLAASPLAAYLGVRSFLKPLLAFVHGRGFPARMALLALTLGVTSCVYAGLYGWTHQRSVAMESASLAHFRAVETVLAEKRAQLRKILQEAFPNLSEEETARLVASTPIQVRPEEIPGRVPLMPVIAISQIRGARAALRGMGSPPLSFGPWFTTRKVALTCLLAAAVLASLASTGGWIWKSG
jgi:hypothetical protein